MAHQLHDHQAALRADFYAHCAEYAPLREAVAHHQEYVGALTPDELRRAIEGPAVQGGWEVESGLVDLLLRDVGVPTLPGSPGVLESPEEACELAAKVGYPQRMRDWTARRRAAGEAGPSGLPGPAT